MKMCYTNANLFQMMSHAYHSAFSESSTVASILLVPGGLCEGPNHAVGLHQEGDQAAVMKQ